MASSKATTVIDVRGMIGDAIRDASQAIDREPPEVSGYKY